MKDHYLKIRIAKEDLAELKKAYKASTWAENFSSFIRNILKHSIKK